jgi:hypothetical protein
LRRSAASSAGRGWTFGAFGIEVFSFPDPRNPVPPSKVTIISDADYIFF